MFFGDIAHADLKNLVRAAIVRTPATNDDTARIPADSFEAWWARHKHQVRLCCGLCESTNQQTNKHTHTKQLAQYVRMRRAYHNKRIREATVQVLEAPAIPATCIGMREDANRPRIQALLDDASQQGIDRRRAIAQQALQSGSNVAIARVVLVLQEALNPPRRAR